MGSVVVTVDGNACITRKGTQCVFDRQIVIVCVAQYMCVVWNCRFVLVVKAGF